MAEDRAENTDGPEQETRHANGSFPVRLFPCPVVDQRALRRAGSLALSGRIVIGKILVTDVVVTWTVLTKSNARMRSAWVSIPLDIGTPEAIAILAGTTTLAPSTILADLSDKGGAPLVQTLVADDPAAMRDELKDRCERH